MTRFFWRTRTASLLAEIVWLAVFVSSPWSTAIGQTSAKTNEPTGSELSSHDEVTTFKVNVNVVLVRVVVRDSQGRAVGNLKRDDFQLFDNRRPQVITSFTVEQPGTELAREQKTTEESTASPTAKPPAIAERYIAYLFDDIHLNNSDLMQVRLAADHNVDTLAPTDRAAIYTTSGQTMLEFTDDRTKLHDSLSRLQSRPIAGSGLQDCPDISYYLADQIQNKSDPQALQAATLDALACAFDNDPRQMSAAQAMASGAASMALSQGNHETQITLGTLKNIVRRMSVLPGQRTVILASPGFFNPEQTQEEMEIIDRALHANVIINALDARGLYADRANGPRQSSGTAAGEA